MSCSSFIYFDFDFDDLLNFILFWFWFWWFVKLYFILILILMICLILFYFDYDFDDLLNSILFWYWYWFSFYEFWRSKLILRFYVFVIAIHWTNQTSKQITTGQQLLSSINFHTSKHFYFQYSVLICAITSFSNWFSDSFIVLPEQAIPA